MTPFTLSERFWLPAEKFDTADSRPNQANAVWGLTLDQFFPEDETSSLSRSYKIERASEESAPPCLVLLGEMGIGKTMAMRSLWEEAKNRSRTRKFHPLIEFDNNGALRKAIEQAAASGTILYLDGLDELNRPGARETLLNALRNQRAAGSSQSPSPSPSPSPPTWNLRLSCRSADWNDDLHEILEAVWGRDSVRIVKLAPLRESDVRAAAKQAGLPSGDVETFIEEIHRRGLVSFARLPLTLGFLLHDWKRNSNLSEDLWELYESNCRELCTDHRGRHAPPNPITSDQRLDIASRLAVALRFGRNDRVCLDPRKGGEGLEIPKLQWCAKQVLGKTISDVEAKGALDDVLTNTGLFRGNATTRWFEHQSYLDFLAARGLENSKLTVKGWFDLLVEKLGEGESGVPPHRRAVAGWLCHRSKEFMEALAEKDFVAVLLANIESMTPEWRRTLVDQLLGNAMRWRVTAGWGRQEDEYRSLNHEGLADQLREWIADAGKQLESKAVSTESRRTAVEMAQYNNLDELAPLLANLALNPKEPVRLRKQAVYALDAFDSVEEIRSLKELLPSIREDDDDDDELKGAVLKALWPRHLIAIRELLAALGPPKKESFYGSYKIFMLNHFVPHLGKADLPDTLLWIENSENSSKRPKRLAEKYDILWMAWNNLFESPEVQEPFLKAALSLMKKYLRVLPEKNDLNDDPYPVPDDHDDRRRFLLTRMLPETHDVNFNTLASWLYRSEFVRDNDFEFFLNSCINELNTKIARRWAKIAQGRLFLTNKYETNLDTLNALIPDSPLLKEIFHRDIGPILLSSEEASVMRKEYAKHMELERQWAEEEARRREESVHPDGWRENNIRNSLSKLKDGKKSAWVGVVQAICDDADGDYHPLQSGNLREQKGWNEIPASLQEEVMEAALAFLREARPEPPIQGYLIVINSAGYSALATLLKSEVPPSDIPSLVAKWVSAIVHQPISFGTISDHEAVHEELLLMALEHAPDETIREVMRHVQWESENGDFAGILYRFKKNHPAALCEALLAFLHELKFSGKFASFLLEQLLEWKCAPAFDQALAAWRESAETGNDGKAINEETAIALVVRLLRSPEIVRAWQEVGPWVLGSDAVGEKVLLGVAYKDLFARKFRFSFLLVEERKKITLFMERVFFRENDGKHMPDGPHRVTEQEDARQFRDELLELFRNNGEVEALEAHLCEFPQYEWLRWHIEEARKNRMQTTARCFAPTEINDILESGIVSLPGRPSPSEDRRTVELALLRIQKLKKGESLSEPFQFATGAAGKSRVQFYLLPNGGCVVAKFDKPERSSREWKTVRDLKELQTPLQAILPLEGNEERDGVILYWNTQGHTRDSVISLQKLIELQLHTNPRNCRDALKMTLRPLELFYNAEPGRATLGVQGRVPSWKEFFPQIREADKIQKIRVLLDNHWDKEITLDGVSRPLLDPLESASNLLDQSPVPKMLSRIHGDANLSNFLIAVDGSHAPQEVFIIDLADSKPSAPTALDLACMETHFWHEVFGGFDSPEDERLRAFVYVRDTLEKRKSKIEKEDTLAKSAFDFVAELRKEAGRLLQGGRIRYLLQDYFEALLLQHVRSLLYPSVQESPIKIKIAATGAALAAQYLSDVISGRYAPGASDKLKMPVGAT